MDTGVKASNDNITQVVLNIYENEFSGNERGVETLGFAVHDALEFLDILAEELDITDIADDTELGDILQNPDAKIQDLIDRVKKKYGSIITS